jgi:peptide/nickel transport system substrate-binding protein
MMLVGSRHVSRRSFLRLAAVGSTMGALSSLVAACSSSPVATPATAPAQPATKPASASQAGKLGGDVAVAQSSDATSLDPAHTTATVDSQIYGSIYDRLVSLDEQNNVVPGLALSWEPASDQKSWTLKLRQGVKFHDGTDFNADAVKVNIERYIDPAMNSPRKGEIPYVTGVTVVDPYTARIELSQPFVILMYSLTGTTGFMVSPAAISKYGDDLARNPVGSGPFVFKEWIKNDHVSATRNPNYWKQGQPYLNSVSYRGIADQSVILNGVRANNIQATYGVAAKDVASIQADADMQLILKPSTSVSSLRLNAASPPFDKKELRQAVSWAIDRAAIEKALYYGTGVPANTFLGPQNLGYNSTINLYTSRDIDRTRALLSSGGQPSGFSFDAQTTNAPEALNLAQAVKSQLEEVGITMNLQLVDGVTLLQKLVDKQFQASFVTYNGGVEPFQGFNRFFYSKSPIDVYGYANPEFDSLLDKAAGTADTQARVALYQQMTAVLSEDCPWIFLRYPAETELFRKEVQGYVFNPDGVLYLDSVWLNS